ncbi:phosphorylase superfamily protein [Podospora fimiseda]|uniref:Phosphorylase superfamily protein n=1 Tax=Podospora fimiseda TaxID=252190 RepID=A0AAN7BMY5_9PEZI|nr:phosphorylase superfamily protein [Podospora fimiseda]
MFDFFWDTDDDPYQKASRDSNHYRTGRIGRDNVALLLSGMGKVNAARALSDLLSNYPNIRLALVVGICGGVPEPKTLGNKELFQILLGDVVISSNIVQLDFGRQIPTGFQVKKGGVKESIGKAERDVEILLDSLKTPHSKIRLEKKADSVLKELQDSTTLANSKITGERKAKYRHFGTAEDKLFSSDRVHRHKSNSSDCSCDDNNVCSLALVSTCDEIGCDLGQVVTSRDRLMARQKWENVVGEEGQEPQSFATLIGTMGSSDTIIGSAKHRDQLTQEHSLIAFEMEGADVWDTPKLSCIVIKGVCDYADSHKNKKWQNYAAATAASTMKALLELRTRPEGPLMSGNFQQAQTNILTRLYPEMKDAWGENTVIKSHHDRHVVGSWGSGWQLNNQLYHCEEHGDHRI